MRAHKLVAILISITIILTVFSPVSSQIVAPPKGTIEPALLPWTLELFRNYNNIPFVSTGFAGVNQIPVVTYTDGMTHNLGYKIDGDINQCGPGNTWTCAGLGVLGLSAGNPISKTAFYKSETGFKLGWVWENSSASGISLLVNSYNNDFSPAASTGIITLISFNITPWDSTSNDTRPALAFDSNGNPHVVAILTTDDDVDHLVYIHPSGQINPSCQGAAGSNSTWICDTIDDGFYGTTVQISMTSADSPRIAYYDENFDNLMYAYPQVLALYQPNCGPEGNTWRCIEVDQGPGADKIDATISMGVGANNYPQIAYLYDHDGQRYLKHARYVSTGGDCGLDWRVISFMPPDAEEIYRWKCTTITLIDSSSPFIAGLPSLQVDPDNYAVIAYAQDHGGPVSLNLTYPAERIGGPSNSYSFEEIDLPLEQTLDLAINSAGLGLIGYKDEYVSGKFLIAWQQFSLNLPIIRR